MSWRILCRERGGGCGELGSGVDLPASSCVSPPPPPPAPSWSAQPETWRHRSPSEPWKASLCPSPAPSPGSVALCVPAPTPAGSYLSPWGPYLSLWGSYPPPLTLYLSEGALEGAELVEAPGRNADHGGQSQEPAQGITPPRVRVLLVVGQRGVLDQGEEEGGLRVRGEDKGAGRAGALCPRPPRKSWWKSVPLQD